MGLNAHTKSSEAVEEPQGNDVFDGAGRLPIELMEEIVARLDNESLRAFSLVNSTMNRIAAPWLYRTVRFWRKQPFPSRAVIAPEVSYQYDPSRIARWPNYVRIIDVHTHWLLACNERARDIDNLTFPLLEAVRVHLRTYFMKIHFGGHYLTPHLIDRSRLSDTEELLHRCELLEHIPAPTVVIRGLTLANMGFLYGTSGLSVDSTFLPLSEHTRRLVLVFVPTVDGIAGLEDGISSQEWTDNIPEQVSDITIIFDSGLPGRPWLPLEGVDLSQEEDLYEDDYDEYFLHFVLDRFRNIGYIVQDVLELSQSNKVTIVNASVLQPVGYQGQLDYTAGMMVIHRLESLLREMLKQAQVPRLRIRQVSFITMNEYLAKHDWQHVFDPEEMAPWLEGMVDEVESDTSSSGSSSS